MQRVLSGEAHCDESEATTALFYSITSTQVIPNHKRIMPCFLLEVHFRSFSCCPLYQANVLQRESQLTAIGISYPEQPGLKGIELGNFLIKRVVHLLQQEMPQIQVCNLS
jgi:hypothetical protein